MPSVPGHSFHILLVEDSEEDAFFFRHALKSSQLRAGFTHVLDGLKAMDYLRAVPPFSDRGRHPFPDMIVTDLKMPGMDGLEFLRWLKRHPTCAVIPTIVLSSSYIPSDVVKAYQSGANAFITKPTGIKELTDLILLTHMFWSQCQRAPPPPNLKCE